MKIKKNSSLFQLEGKSWNRGRWNEKRFIKGKLLSIECSSRSNCWKNKYPECMNVTSVLVAKRMSPFWPEAQRVEKDVVLLTNVFVHALDFHSFSLRRKSLFILFNFFFLSSSLNKVPIFFLSLDPLEAHAFWELRDEHRNHFYTVLRAQCFLPFLVNFCFTFYFRFFKNIWCLLNSSLFQPFFFFFA